VTDPVAGCDCRGGLQEPNGGEPFGIGRLGEISVSANQGSTPGTVIAPNHSSSKLQGVCRAKLVNTEQAFGTLSNVFGRLNLVPAPPQIVKTRKGLSALINV
jgi:hypothetical protein